MPGLQVLRLRLAFTPERALTLPEFTGSLWRGAFGHALREVVCGLGARGCGSCPLRGHCPYPLFFDELPELTGQARYAAPPRPYVIEPGPQHGPIEPGQPLEVGLVLIGNVIPWLPSVIQAFHLAGLNGVGAQRAPLALREVAQQQGSGWLPLLGAGGGLLQPATADLGAAPPSPAALTLSLLTPLRLRRQGRLVSPDTFRFDDLHRNLAQRVRLLARLYGGAAADGAEGEAEPVEVEVRQRLEWHEWSRWSNRQKSHMKLGGVVGEVALAGDGLAAAWPLLWAGQWLHAGGGVSFGLGHYACI